AAPITTIITPPQLQAFSPCRIRLMSVRSSEHSYMKKFALTLSFICALVLSTFQVLAQARHVTNTAPTAAKDERSASALYDEASGYAARKFQEFASKKMPYDPKLVDKTLKEQKELA